MTTKYECDSSVHCVEMKKKLKLTLRHVHFPDNTKLKNRDITRLKDI